MWNSVVCHTTLYWKSSLKVVQRRWYLTPSEPKQNCCPPLKLFLTREQHQQVIRTLAYEPPAVGAGVNPVPSWAPQLPSECWIQWPDPHQSPGDPASQRHCLETYPPVMVTSLPPAATNPSRATAWLRGEARQCHAEQQRSSLPADFCRPELNRAALRGCAEGNELVPYTDCFNSVTFMYWKLKPERCF